MVRKDMTHWKRFVYPVQMKNAEIGMKRQRKKNAGKSA